MRYVTRGDKKNALSLFKTKIKKWIPFSCQVDKDTKFDTNVSNEMLLNAAKC